MISLQNHLASFPLSMCEYSASKDGRFAWFLCTYHTEQDHVLEEIQTEIKLEILNSDVSSISKINIEAWLKSFFADFHWKLHARFRKTELDEKGISLFFGVLFDHELFFVQFGRLVCALADRKKVTPVGKPWKNHHVNTLEDLALLGLSEKDIKIRINRIFISEIERLIVLPAAQATVSFPSGADPQIVDTVFETYKQEHNPLWLCLKAKERMVLPRQRRSSRLVISTIVLLLMTLLSIFYMIFGNRAIDRYSRKLRSLFISKRTATLEIIPEFLNQETSNLLRNIERVVVSPAQDVQLKLRWTVDMPYRVTCTPAFSLDNLYLASGKTLVAYKKKTREVLWKTAFNCEILDLRAVEQSLIVILEDNRIVSFKASGSKNWEKTLAHPPLQRGIHNSIELNNHDDPSLEGSVIVVADERGLYVLNPGFGEDYSKLTFKNKIQFLSAYDSHDRCLYSVVDQDFHCIELIVKN
ncbi:MAG: PQQ-binding-like beta-propeller repeat protein [Candidatus Cloacimonetes bacterium]|nr:PQQ-binding-like beta-propeller repeat protein [Candidatus Cloacimonadota bacterium]